MAKKVRMPVSTSDRPGPGRRKPKENKPEEKPVDVSPKVDKPRTVTDLWWWTA